MSAEICFPYDKKLMDWNLFHTKKILRVYVGFGAEAYRSGGQMVRGLRAAKEWNKNIVFEIVNFVIQAPYSPHKLVWICIRVLICETRVGRLTWVLEADNQEVGPDPNLT